MKKTLLISLLAMMLIGMLAFTACKPQPKAEEAEVEEVLEEEAGEPAEAIEDIDVEAAEEAEQVAE